MIRRITLMLSLFSLMVLHGCGGCGGTKQAPSAPTPAPSAPQASVKPQVPTPTPTETIPTMTAKVKVMSLDGKPLAGMVPIVTRTQNAFDPPVWTGEPTDAAGMATFAFPGNEKFCLRAWDSALGYFPNNFYDVDTITEDGTTDVEIQMVASAALGLLLLNADRTPVVQQTVRLMMLHPTRGPWWPSEGKTNEAGVLVFPHVPPGQFAVQLETTSGRIRIEDVTMMPGAAADLGALTLEPLN